MYHQTCYLVLAQHSMLRIKEPSTCHMSSFTRSTYNGRVYRMPNKKLHSNVHQTATTTKGMIENNNFTKIH